MSENKRIFGLDLLRTSAIFFVVYHHGYAVIKNTSLGNLIPEKVYSAPVFDGVSIFFVLSGFLIGRILLRTVLNENFNGRMLIEFWIRRWFRTLPNYLLVLSFLVIHSYIFDPQFENRTFQLYHYYTFTQNLASPHPIFFNEAWSLSVEEWFYLSIPIPLYFSTKIYNIDIRKIILFLIFSVIVFTTLYRFYHVHDVGYSAVEFYFWDLNLRKEVVTRLDSLMFGVLGAYVSIFYKDLWAKIATPAVVIGLGLLLFDRAKSVIFHDIMFYVNYFSLTVTAVGTLLLLPKLSSWKVNSGFFVDIITFVSLISYSMYLLNLTPVQEIILPFVMSNVMSYLWSFEAYRGFIAYFLCSIVNVFSIF